MYAFWEMLKMNAKLVLRSKQALALIILIPLLSTLILKLTHVEEGKDPAREYKMAVLIVDESKGTLSKQIIQTLQSDASMTVEIENEQGIDEKSVKTFFTQKANKSVKSCFVYIPSSFEEKVLKGEMQDALLLFDTGTDERAQLLNAELDMLLGKYMMFSQTAQGDKNVFNHLVQEAQQNETKEQVVLLNQKGETAQKNETGYSFSINMFVAAITMVLLFSNIFIAGLFIKEKGNGVLKRIQLTNTSMLSYTMAKIILAVSSLVIQTGLIMTGIQFIVKMDLGISIWTMGFLIFMLGLVLTCLSVCTVSLLDNITTANYVGLGFITVANMLAGLYFPLESTPDWMQKIAMLLPQRWFVYTADELLKKNTQILYQYSMVMTALILLFLSVSLLGFKFRKTYN